LHRRRTAYKRHFCLLAEARKRGKTKRKKANEKMMNPPFSDPFLTNTPSNLIGGGKGTKYGIRKKKGEKKRKEWVEKAGPKAEWTWRRAQKRNQIFSSREFGAGEKKRAASGERSQEKEARREA